MLGASTRGLECGSNSGTGTGTSAGADEWFWGSDRNFAAKRSEAPEGRAAGSGNLRSDPENTRSRSHSHELFTRYPFELSLSKPLPEWGLSFVAMFRCRSMPRRAPHLSPVHTLRQRKATLISASLRFAAATCDARFKRRQAENRLWLKQMRALIRLKLRSLAQTEEVCPNPSSGSSAPASPAHCRYVSDSSLRTYSFAWWPKTLEKLPSHLSACGDGFRDVGQTRPMARAQTQARLPVPRACALQDVSQ